MDHSTGPPIFDEGFETILRRGRARPGHSGHTKPPGSSPRRSVRNSRSPSIARERTRLQRRSAHRASLVRHPPTWNATIPVCASSCRERARCPAPEPHALRKQVERAHRSKANTRRLQGHFDHPTRTPHHIQIVSDPHPTIRRSTQPNRVQRECRAPGLFYFMAGSRMAVDTGSDQTKMRMMNRISTRDSLQQHVNSQNYIAPIWHNHTDIIAVYIYLRIDLPYAIPRAFD